MRWPNLILILLFSAFQYLYSQPGTIIHQFSSPTNNPADLTWDGQYLYLLGLVDHVIYQIDPANGQVLSTTSTGISGAMGLTYVDGHFWISVISDNTLKKLDANGSVIKSVSIPTAQAIGIEWDGTTFRVADSGAPDEKILQVDSLGTLLHSFLFPGDSPFGLTWDGNTIWCADNQMGGTATIYQFEPVSGAVITSFSCPGGGGSANGLAWDGQYLWIAVNTNDMIYQVEGNPLPQFGAIEGHIRDAMNGWGIGFIPVLDTYTDTSGYYLADSLQQGMYEITFASLGFQSQTISNIEVTAGDTATVDVDLVPIGDPFDFILRESDGDEWYFRDYRDSVWRYFEIPLGRFRGQGVNFLDTTVYEFVMIPVGGNTPILQFEVTDWIDDIMLGDSLIDDFDDGDFSDWIIDIALNGSYLDVEVDPLTPDTSNFCLKMRHGNTMGQPFAGFLLKRFTNWLTLLPGDSMRFWLRGTVPYLVSIEEVSTSVTETFELEQNYPNPFNSETVIHYQLPASGKVELSIYNLLGQKIKTLVSGKISAGQHQLRWDGRDKSGRLVPSGVYIYRLRGEGFFQSRKMLFLK